MKMGIGFIQTNPLFPKLFFNASVTMFPSSTRAEIYAVLAALCIVPIGCAVDIFTDSQNVIYGMQQILDKNFLGFTSLRKDNNYLLWLNIFDLISEKGLTVICNKVKAHTDNVLNNEVYLLAKKGFSKNPFIYNVYFISKDKYIFNWSHVNIDSNVRQFVK